MCIALPLLVALFTSSPARHLPESITYETRAANAEAVLRDLGKQWGTRITLSPDLSREVVVIKVKGVTGEELLQQLAAAMQAEFRQTDDGWRIERTGAIRKTQEESDRQKMAQRLDDWLKEYNESREQKVGEGEAMPEETAPEEQPVNPEDQKERRQAMEFYQKKAVLDEALWKAVRESASGSLIASIGLKQRIVWSSSPTPRQRPLAPAVQTAFRTYNNDLAKLSKTVPEGLKLEFADAFRPIQRLLLIIERTSPYEWNIVTKALTQDNIKLVHQQSGASLLWSKMPIEGGDAKNPPKPTPSQFKLNDPGTAIPTPEAFKTLSVFINAVSQGSPPPMVDQKEMLSFFQTPAKNEPLSLTTTSALLALADDQKANLVAIVPDDAFALEESVLTNQTLTLGSAMEQLESLPTLDFDSHDGWILLKARYPSISEACRLDREALQSLIDLEAADGDVSILARGQFWLTYPEFSPTLWQLYSSLALPSLMGSMFEGGGELPDAYRFFATLNPPDRAELLAGRPVSVARLSPDARYHLERSIKEITTTTGDNPELQSWFMRWTGRDTQEQPDRPPFEDVTDFPPQSNAEAVVLATVHRDYVVRPMGNDFSFFMGNMSADSLAMMRQMRNSPDAGEWSSMMPKFDQFRVGDRTRLDLKFIMAAPYGGRAIISGVQMTGDPAGMPFNRLPQPFLDAVRKAEEAFRRMTEDVSDPAEGQPSTPPGQKP